MNQNPGISDFSWENFRVNSTWLLLDHPHAQLNTSNLLSNNPLLYSLQCLYTSIMALFLGLFLRCFGKGQTRLSTGILVISGLVLVVAFLFFHTLQLSRWTFTWGNWWYGSLFSLVYVIAVTIMMQFILEGTPGKLFKQFFIFIVMIVLVHSLAFTTYRMGMFVQRVDNNFNYTKEDVFYGRIGQFYKNFSLVESMKRSHCRQEYVGRVWKRLKNKDLVFCRNTILQNNCAQKYNK